MTRKRLLINQLFAIILIFSMLAVPTVTALAKKDKALSIDPDFLKLVQEYPDEMFRVIVQRDAKKKDLKEMELENSVKNGGGNILKQLDLIVSFSAEMTGKKVEKMAKNPKVRWISPDAPVVSTGTGGLSTLLDTFELGDYYDNFGTHDWDGGWTL